MKYNRAADYYIGIMANDATTVDDALLADTIRRYSKKASADPLKFQAKTAARLLRTIEGDLGYELQPDPNAADVAAEAAARTTTADTAAEHTAEDVTDQDFADAANTTRAEQLFGRGAGVTDGPAADLRGVPMPLQALLDLIRGAGGREVHVHLTIEGDVHIRS